MKRFHIIFIGTLSTSFIFSVIIYFRVLTAPYAAPFISIFLWQLIVWTPWLIFGYLASKLDHRYPMVEQPLKYWILRHSSLCSAVLIAHGVWFFVISSNFSPFLGVENTRYGAFLFFFIMWLIFDFLFYWLLLGVFALKQLLTVSPVTTNVEHDRLQLKTTGRQHYIHKKDILWIDAEDYCCRVYTLTDNYLVRQSLNSFQETLHEPEFVRIHRSTIVKVNYIEAIEKSNNRRHIIRFRNNEVRAASTSGRKRLQKILDA